MMHRILTLLRQDLTLITRDSIVLYIFAAPVLLALLARVLLPTFQDTIPTVVVGPGVSETVREELQNYAQLYPAADQTELEHRVAQTDDVAGIRVSPDSGAAEAEHELVLQGNETPESRELFATIAAAAFGAVEPVSARHEVTGNENGTLTGYTTLVMVIMATLLGAMIAGFNIVDDRSTGAIRALAVSPLRLRDYLASRGLFCLLFAFLAGVLVSLIMLGSGVALLKLMVALVAGTPLVVVLGYAMGLIAKDQIAAVGLGKILIPAYMVPAVLPIFLPEQWHALLFPFPNYWYFVTFENVFFGTSTLPYLPALGLTVAGGLAAALLMQPPLRRALRLR